MSTMVAQPSASGSGISPREKMRVAKLALMADEDSEVNARRERRKSRRQSELGIMPGASPSTSDASSNSMVSQAIAL